MSNLIFSRIEKNMVVIMLTIVLSFSFCLSGSSQNIEVSKEYQITLVDGNTVIGRVASLTDTELELVTNNMGTITIQRSNIKKVTLMSEQDSLKGWFPNPNKTRYLFGPTGRNMEKGEGYYQNVLLVLNTVHYGLTDWFSIGGGIEAISTSTGNPIFLIVPKVGFDITEKFSMGGGVFYGNAVFLVDELSGGSGLGIAYGTATYGDENTHGTFGVGYAFAGGEFASRPIFTISGAARLSRRFGFVTENWIFPKILGTEENYYVITYGVRFIGEKSTFDWAFIAPKGVGEVFPIGLPVWISYTFHF